MFKILLAASAAFALAASANAVTVISSSNGPDTGVPAGQHLVTDFSTAAGLSGVFALETGSVDGQYAAPLGDATQYLAVLGGNTATLALSPALRALSFYWGSIDDYNTVSFYNGASLVSSFTGAQVPPAPADGSQGNVLNTRRVNFNFGNDKITSVLFSSGQNSFELDTIAGSAVPEPQAWVMLIIGFGLVGANVRRRNRISAVAA